ncbi:MAG: response regulator transcription factor [Planctomycetaceae bacterium]
MAFSETTAISTVLVVDDHPIVRRGFAMMLRSEEDFKVVGEAADLTEAFQLYRQHKPDLVMVDVMLRQGNGLELTKDLVALNPNVKVLICSVNDESLYAERALRAGAKGYVCKHSEPKVIIAAMRRVLRGQLYLSENMVNRMLARAVGGNGQNLKVSPMDSLSDRELEVFEEIGHGFTTRQIAQKLELSPKTIETYRENLKLKLHLRNATELTQHAVKWMLENSGERNNNNMQTV